MHGLKSTEGIFFYLNKQLRTERGGLRGVRNGFTIGEMERDLSFLHNRILKSC